MRKFFSKRAARLFSVYRFLKRFLLISEDFCFDHDHIICALAFDTNFLVKQVFTGTKFLLNVSIAVVFSDSPVPSKHQMFLMLFVFLG